MLPLQGFADLYTISAIYFVYNEMPINSKNVKSQLLTILFFCFLSIAINAQDSGLKIEANYPIAMGEFKNEYAGIVDIGVEYLFLEMGPVNLGVSINGGLLKNSSKGQFNSEIDLKIISFQPKVVAELTSLKSLNLYPQIGIGYSTLFFRSKIREDLGPELWNERGLNINLGISYQLNSVFFIQAQYDYLNIKSFGLEWRDYFSGQISDVGRKTKGGLLKVGFGIKI